MLSKTLYEHDNLQKAKEIRHHWDSRMWFSVPGSRHYETLFYSNRPYSFATLSVTGSQCACRCEHCNARLLHSMIPAETPVKMYRTVDRLIERGCRGILISGGADEEGQVPIEPFLDAIRYAKDRGLTVLVHTGLIGTDMAFNLKNCGVDQILIDVIGHEQTIRDVYHLERTPDDYLETMIVCREAGLNFVPHVVIGLHFGQILGEYRALEMIREIRPERLVLVVLTPSSDTGMSHVKPPQLSEVKKVLAAARVRHPDTFLNLGCAKPAGIYKRQVEEAAIDCGFNGIAYPSESAIEYAIRLGFTPVFTESCCSLSGDVLRIQTKDNTASAALVVVTLQ